MAPEVAAALIGACAGFAGAVIAAGAAIRAARHQAGKAVEGAFAQASAAYLGPLDTARRTAQREAYARLLTAAHDYETAVKPVLDASVALNRRATPDHPAMSPETRADLRARIDEVNDHHPVDLAVQHVLLEGPYDVWQSAARVQIAAMTLRIALTPGGTTGPLNNPREAHAQLYLATQNFAQAAAAHLNQRDLTMGQRRQVRPRWWRRSGPSAQ